MYAGALLAIILITAVVFGTALLLAVLTEPHQSASGPVEQPLDLTRGPRDPGSAPERTVSERDPRVEHSRV